MRRILFVCGKNRLRSPTAEAIFSAFSGWEVSSAGIAPDADCVLDAELVSWATDIVVMEKVHLAKVRSRYRGLLGAKRIVCLDIPDRYTYMQPELIAELQAKASRWKR